MACKIAFIVFLCGIASFYGINMKQLYSSFFIELYYEPSIRFISYFLIFIIALFDFNIALVFTMILLMFRKVHRSNN